MLSPHSDYHLTSDTRGLLDIYLSDGTNRSNTIAICLYSKAWLGAPKQTDYTNLENLLSALAKRSPLPLLTLKDAM
jgi:hypothetical protein